VTLTREKIVGALKRSESMRKALENSQSLLVAMLNEQRPTEEIEAQISENRAALTPGFFDSAKEPQQS
jgi:hypothetical protein